MISRSDIKDLIIQHNLQKEQAYIMSLAKPAIHLTLVRRPHQREFPLGQSRFGGLPDLAWGMDWPDDGEKPLNFLGQINLKVFSSLHNNPYLSLIHI